MSDVDAAVPPTCSGTTRPRRQLSPWSRRGSLGNGIRQLGAGTAGRGALCRAVPKPNGPAYRGGSNLLDCNDGVWYGRESKRARSPDWIDTARNKWRVAMLRAVGVYTAILSRRGSFGSGSCEIDWRRIALPLNSQSLNHLQQAIWRRSSCENHVNKWNRSRSRRKIVVSLLATANFGLSSYLLVRQANSTQPLRLKCRPAPHNNSHQRDSVRYPRPRALPV